MDRLTKLDGIGREEIIKCFDCDSKTAGSMNEHCGMCEHWYDVTAKLADYEDTNLTPEEITELKQQGAEFWYMQRVEELQTENERLNDFQNSQCAKLLAKNGEWQAESQEHKRKIDQGLIIELPCKVGDTVYELRHGYVEEEIFNLYNLACVINQLGKTVFLTKEDAERASKEREGK